MALKDLVVLMDQAEEAGIKNFYKAYSLRKLVGLD